MKRMISETENLPNVILTRPFVYAIIDNETNLPLFIGSFLSIP